MQGGCTPALRYLVFFLMGESTEFSKDDAWYLVDARGASGRKRTFYSPRLELRVNRRPGAPHLSQTPIGAWRGPGPEGTLTAPLGPAVRRRARRARALNGR